MIFSGELGNTGEDLGKSCGLIVRIYNIMMIQQKSITRSLKCSAALLETWDALGWRNFVFGTCLYCCRQVFVQLEPINSRLKVSNKF